MTNLASTTQKRIKKPKKVSEQQKIIGFLQQKFIQKKQPKVETKAMCGVEISVEQKGTKKSDQSMVTFIDSYQTTRVSLEKNIESVDLKKFGMANIKISNMFSKTRAIKQQQQMRKNQLCQILKCPVKPKLEQTSRREDTAHVELAEGTVLQGKYIVGVKLGEGTFGRCYSVSDRYSGKQYAAKVIKKVERFIGSAREEVVMIEKIHEMGGREAALNRAVGEHVVKVVDQMDAQETFIIIFERLGVSLYDLLEKSHFKGLSLQQIQTYGTQMLRGLSALHSLGVTHTDIRPENILLGLQDQSLKLIDFGGATFNHEHHSSLINTRQYRAPEVILLSHQWDTRSDLWGLGVLLVELFTGQLYFDTHDDNEQLGMMQTHAQIPLQMLIRSKKGEFSQHLNARQKARVTGFQTLEKLVPAHDSLHQAFLDLLRRMLTIDPKQRMTAEQALAHSFFTSISP